MHARRQAGRAGRALATTVAVLLIAGCGHAGRRTATATVGTPAAASISWQVRAPAGGTAATVAGHGWTVTLRGPGPAGSTLSVGTAADRAELPAARAALTRLNTELDVTADEPVAIELAGGALPAAGATVTRQLAAPLPAAGRATLAYYDPEHDAWTAVASTLAADRRTLSAPVAHFSIWDTLTYGAGWLADTRVGAPSCPGAAPAWARDGVIFLDDMNAPLRWCVGAEPTNPDVLVVKVAVNRGYGVAVTPQATPSRVADSIFNGSSDDILVRIMAGVLTLPNNYGKGILLLPGGATAELAFSEAAVRAAGGTPLVTVSASPEYMLAGEIYTAITKAYGPGDGPAAVVIALLGVAQCGTSFGPALGAGDAPAAASAGFKCLVANAGDIDTAAVGVLAKQFPTAATGAIGQLASKVGAHLWPLWAAGLTFGVSTWFADHQLSAEAWALSATPKPRPTPTPTPASAPSFLGQWSTHGTALSVDSTTSGHEEENVGPCNWAEAVRVSGPMCQERIRLRFTASANGTMLTGTATAAAVVETVSAVPRPDVAPRTAVGATFTLQFFTPTQLIRIGSEGISYWCGAKTPVADQHRCGA